MKIVIDYISTFALLSLSQVSRLLSINGRVKLGKIIAKFLMKLSNKRYSITLDNILKAFPELSESDCKQICRESYENLGITLVELLALPSMGRKDIEKYVKFDNMELIREVYQRGKGLLFISAHFGNWELTGYALGLLSGVPLSIIVKGQKNKILDKYLNKYRSLAGNKMIPMGQAARAIIKILKEKEGVAMLVDQSANEKKDIFIDFFSRPASTYEAPATLALKYKCPLIIGFPFRQKDNTYLVHIEEIDYSDLDNSQESIIELSRRHVQILEETIRSKPGHWAWQHRKWKHSPPEDSQNDN